MPGVIPRWLRRPDLRGRFSYLLGFMLLIFVIAGLVGPSSPGRLVNQALFLSLLVFAVSMSTRGRRPLILVVVLAPPALVVNWLILTILYNGPLVVAGHGLFIAVLALAIGSSLCRVMRDERVTYETIAGALFVYLLIGIAGGYMYSLIEFLRPGSIHVAAAVQQQTGGPQQYFYPHSGFGSMLYYSFVTLATVGYGDITPIAPAARTLSILEAITGQLYLAVLIARLVGLHIVHSGRRRE